MQLLEALLSKLRDYLETMKEFRFSTDLQVRSIKNTCFFFIRMEYVIHQLPLGGTLYTYIQI